MALANSLHMQIFYHYRLVFAAETIGKLVEEIFSLPSHPAVQTGQFHLLSARKPPPLGVGRKRLSFLN
jgi:hypothetical protein